MIPAAVDWDSIVSSVFVFDNYGELLALLSNSLWAGALLGLVGGLVGTFVMMRDLAFSVHGIAELSFAGAAAALLIGSDIVTGSLLGSVLAALIIGFMGLRARDSNSFVGVLMPFGLGLGILFLSLYEGRSSNKFSLLTGQIVSVSPVQLTSMIVLSIVVVAGLLIVWRPLTAVAWPLPPSGTTRSRSPRTWYTSSSDCTRFRRGSTTDS